MMFAALVFDRDPLRMEDLPFGVIRWIQSAGGFATVGLILFLLLGLPRWRSQDRASVPGWMSGLFMGATGLSFLSYIGFGLSLLAFMGKDPFTSRGPLIAGILLTVASASAIVAVIVPFLTNVVRMRVRRIFALAKLSFKEAIRRRVLYAFSAILLVFLFATWFVDSKPADQVRTYVSIVSAATTYLLMATALFLVPFSIPTDIKQQTIHTIVTKPVERFEIVLGRFFGFLALMTIVLIVMTGLSLLYVLREINPDAAAESLKARVPVYGFLSYENTDNERVGVNVGREWEYRSYITRPSPGQQPPTARWDFPAVPANLADRKEVRCEYTFDVYRTTKGDEGRAVYCTFRLFTWRFKKGNDDLFRSEREKRRKESQISDADLNNELAEKYGYFELNSQPVEDYRTLHFNIPGGLFKNLNAADPERESELKASREIKVPLRTRVVCDSATQFVGMARYDFYLRLDDTSAGNDRARFAINFFKGAFGLWLQLAVLIGIAVALSTYLNGVITFLVAQVLLFGGLGREFVESVAFGRNAGGGPVESMVRITRRELTGSSMADSASISDQIVTGSDEAFRWFVRRVIEVIPDIDRYDLTNYVAEGFDISFTQMGLEFLLMCGYLLPWAVLSYYLIRWREVASSS
jgi:hypothetical protein